ncbi:MAG: hypothetical protein AUG09_01565 [Acidobacteria bacterium 13_1_20CM_2_68_7]|nr:MAG: hypothetical protein AUG09_01565 [Acidobacteria bacterium 13_1_20CM_2_68_7]
MMAGRGIQGPSAIETRGFVPGLSRKIVLGAALVLAVLGALVVWAGAAAVDRLGFESMRQRGASLARLLALASEQALERSGADALKPLLDTITGAGDLVYVEIVDRGGSVLAEGGASGSRPVYAARGVPLAPQGRDDRTLGVSGASLYIFTFPITGGTPGQAPSAIASERNVPGTAPAPPEAGGPGEYGLGPRSAGAAQRRDGPAAAPGAVSTSRTMAFPGEVRVAFAAAGLDEARRTFVWQVSLLGLLVALGGTLLADVFTRRLVVGPAQTLALAAERLARGDLTRRAGLRSADEIGAVGGEIDAFSDRLEAVIGGMQDETRRMAEAMDTIEASVSGVLSGTRDKRELLDRVSRAAEATARSTKNVAQSVASLSASSEETTSSILTMVATIEEVAAHADGLTISVEDTAATTEEMVASIKEIDRNVELLNQFVAETSEAMARMGRVIDQVERNAADSKAISELVAANAEKGMRAVVLTIEGMDGIYGSVSQTKQVIESVGRKGQEIGLILNVIQEVTEQTNLLALNAAIIAAQAGEHGRGFAVVAEEIRQLAERTATSAKEIGNLIAAFQSETGRAVDAMQEGMRRVEEGSERSREAGKALKEILESARQSSDRVGMIAAATREQAGGSQAVGASVEKVREMAAQIKKATNEQTLGSEQIMSAVENMREMSSHVKRATAEQTRGSRSVTSAIGNVGGMIASIHRATTEQSEASDQVLKGLAEIASVCTTNLAAAERLRDALEALRARARSLGDQAGGFTTRH